METGEKINLIKNNTEEIITEEALAKLLEKKSAPVVYCGYEPSGPLHLGHFVTITKLLDLQNLGFKIKILLADLHAMLNRKGDENKIKKEVESWTKTIKAIGLKCDVVLGSDFQFKKEYQLDIMKLSQHSTINRGLRSMQEVARDIENGTISQLWYPLMQIADIKHLKVDVALGGLEQRKVHMMGKDMKDILEYDFIALHTPLITSLKGPGEKMSKSIPGSGISVTDSKKEIEKIISQAYCPEKVVKDNPILQICGLIIFPHNKKILVQRPAKFGGDVYYVIYQDLETDYKNGRLHPADLKKAVAENLDRIIEPIRKNFK